MLSGEEKMANTSDHQSRMYSSQLNFLMRDILQTLSNIDFAHQLEIEKVEASKSDAEMKEYIKDKLHRSHQQRRQPYGDLLNELRRKQHQQSFVA
jgi:hypothetical protein